MSESIDDLVREVTSYVTALQAENAKLRELRAEMYHRAKAYSFENAKLRELLLELYEDQCDECDRWKYRDRMRKLGIEVE